MTYTVPGPWPATRGVVIARAPKGCPIRVDIRNLGGGVLALAYDQNDLISSDGPSARTYRLPADAATIFVLAPDQKLFAMGDAAGIQVSVASNEAFPIGDSGKYAL
jgi:hypothetical protein